MVKTGSLPLLCAAFIISCKCNAGTPYLPYCSGRPITLIELLAATLQVVPRGGWLFRRKKEVPPAEKYEATLEGQIQLVNGHLAETREELVETRLRFKAARRARVAAMVDVIRMRLGGRPKLSAVEKALREDVESLKQQISVLEQEMEKLIAMNSELQEMFETEQQKVLLLQSKLDQVEKESHRLKESYENQLEELQQRLEAKMAEQLEELRIMMQGRLENALKNAEQKHAMELEEAIREAEQGVQSEADKQLEEVRQTALEQVEYEKAKMRKLVRALSKREERLLKALNAPQSEDE